MTDPTTQPTTDAGEFLRPTLPILPHHLPTPHKGALIDFFGSIAHVDPALTNGADPTIGKRKRETTEADMGKLDSRVQLPRTDEEMVRIRKAAVDEISGDLLRVLTPYVFPPHPISLPRLMR